MNVNTAISDEIEAGCFGTCSGLVLKSQRPLMTLMQNSMTHTMALINEKNFVTEELDEPEEKINEMFGP